MIIKQTIDVYMEMILSNAKWGIRLRAARLRRDKEVVGKG
jgi:hypothetical protein